MKKLFLQAMMALAFAGGLTYDLQAIQPTTRKVYTFDHDDVINTKEKLGVIDWAKFLGVAGKVAWRDPRGAAGLLWNWRAIKARGEQVSQNISGTSNIIYALAQDLKKDGYVDLTPYVEEMTAITVKPTPIWQTINYIKELKKQGYTIIGATNQDYYQNKYFRERMAAQGVHMEELFDAVLVGHTVLKAQDLPKKRELVHKLEEGVYMPTSAKGCKPNDVYFYALKELAKKHKPNANTFIHTDDKQENIQGAHKVKGFAKSVLFPLPEGKSARKCTPQELQATFDAWKSAIEKKN